jgi:hypothetical protein
VAHTPSSLLTPLPTDYDDEPVSHSIFPLPSLLSSIQSSPMSTLRSAIRSRGRGTGLATSSARGRGESGSVEPPPVIPPPPINTETPVDTGAPEGPGNVEPPPCPPSPPPHAEEEEDLYLAEEDPVAQLVTAQQQQINELFDMIQQMQRQIPPPASPLPKAPPLPENFDYNEMRYVIAALQNQVTNLRSQCHPTSPIPPVAAPPVIKIAKPKPFNGLADKVHYFLFQCNLYLCSQAYADKDRQLFILSYMTAGHAKVWAEQEGQNLDEARWYTQTYEELKNKIECLFGDSNCAATTCLKINQLFQGSHSVDEYNVDFDQQACLTHFDEEALIDFYKRRLNPFVRDKIYTLPDIPNTLDE